jgi:hypothetical protein
MPVKASMSPLYMRIRGEAQRVVLEAELRGSALAQSIAPDTRHLSIRPGSGRGDAPKPSNPTSMASLRNHFESTLAVGR